MNKFEIGDEVRILVDTYNDWNDGVTLGSVHRISLYDGSHYGVNSKSGSSTIYFSPYELEKIPSLEDIISPKASETFNITINIPEGVESLGGKFRASNDILYSVSVHKVPENIGRVISND